MDSVFLPFAGGEFVPAKQFVECLCVNVERFVFADVALDGGKDVQGDWLGFFPMQFKPVLQLAHVARGLDLDVQLDVLREAWDGEIAGAHERDGANDSDARMRDVRFSVKFLFGVGAAFDLAIAQRLHD